MKIGVIIQARIGSSRLPGKVLKKINGKPLLEHVIERAKKIGNIYKIIVATTENYEDNEIVALCKSKKIEVYRGSEGDVLSRYYKCAKKYELDHIIRLTADNPLVEISELTRLVNLHIITKSDYSESMTQLPIGIGSEIFSMDALETSERLGLLPHHREHVNEYILENKSTFKTVTLNPLKYKNKIEHRFTIDTIEDFNFVSRIMMEGRKGLITLDEVIEICTQFV